MGLTERPERKSLFSSYTDNDDTVFAVNATYGERNVSLSVDIFNSDYVAEHKAEVEELISGFISRLNSLLTESNLPTIQG